MTAPDLDELRRLREQATPGPWRQGNVDTHQVFAAFDDGLAGPGGERVVASVNDRSDKWDWLADARLIVAAVNALPGLLTELAHLRSRVAELERERNEAQANYRFMVERAADQKLDGYRELGQRAADAENLVDRLRSLLAEAREVVRPFAEAYGAVRGTLVDPWAGPNEYARAANWLRKQGDG
jgi:hypothetical protein